ncbi:MAG: hypothetical protein L0Y72_12235 [Gemmataceae bacterium]|nr:hypothetical protein [Gemmataceae bacterium]MCI0739806.1 hypothetical protein [Gemmataceae bacterium]
MVGSVIGACMLFVGVPEAAAQYGTPKVDFYSSTYYASEFAGSIPIGVKLSAKAT